MAGWANYGQVWVSAGALVGGALAYLVSPLVSVGLLSAGWVLLGTWLGVYLNNKEYHDRLLGSLSAELTYNRQAVKDVISFAERDQLKNAIVMPHLRTAMLAEASGKSLLLGLADRDSDVMVATLRSADLVNEALSMRERVQLLITMGRDAMMDAVQATTQDVARIYLNNDPVVSELVRSLRTGEYDPKKAASAPPPAAATTR